jgi:hypothetical protein
VELAHILKKGIENDVFYILPFADPEQAQKDNFEHILNYATPAGMKRQQEIEQNRRAETGNQPNPVMDGAEEAGWGKANEKIPWVVDEHRVKK